MAKARRTSSALSKTYSAVMDVNSDIQVVYDACILEAERLQADLRFMSAPNQQKARGAINKLSLAALKLEEASHHLESLLA